LHDLRVGVAFSYGLAATHLLGDAKDSPIVPETSSLSGGMTASYWF